MGYFHVNLILIVRSGFMPFKRNIDASIRVIIFGLCVFFC